jgi:putative thioredoxin
MADIAARFQEDVIEKSHTKPVVVDFWAPWCGPCRTLSPVLDKLAKESQGAWRLVKINTDKHPQLAQRYNVRGIPAVKLFVDGAIADEFVGARPEAFVHEWIEPHLPASG